MSTILVTLLSTFLASAVEFVEALTVVLAVGLTRQWRSTLLGAGAAAVALAAIVVVFGTALATLVPIELLRLVVGAVLLVFGLQWLTKAILRAAGARATRNEQSAFDHELAVLAEEPPVPDAGVDWISFTLAFKGVLLEGLEVAFIVVTFGAAGGMLGVAAVGAGSAGALVLLAGVFLRRPLAGVPENTLKFGVGVMLTTFGTFWGGEGVGVQWPVGDATLLVLLGTYLATSLVAVRLAARDLQTRRGSAASARAAGESSGSEVGQ